MAPTLKNVLHSFTKHVKDLCEKDENDEDGFTKEFQMLRDEAQSARQCNLYPAEEGKLDVNIRKNRYKDILPYDETRVILANEDDTPGAGGDYINANFVKDVVGNYGYIAAQGPLPHTVDDFWEMIWQNDIEVIVMVCREVEKSKSKCERYWAQKSEEKTFKDITVTLTEECPINTYYCMRHLLATRGGEERTITQFHYTGWLDHDIPAHYSDIIDLITNMRESQDDTERPIIVHCSAGCGRTGTICAVDYAWSKLRIGDMDDDFSLFDIIREMRTQRPSMVQTPDQYRVAHLAVAHFFQEHLRMMARHEYENVELENIEIKLDTDLINSTLGGATARLMRTAPQNYENHVIMNQVEIDAATCPKTKDKRQVKRAIAMFNSTKRETPKKPGAAKTVKTGPSDVKSMNSYTNVTLTSEDDFEVGSDGREVSAKNIVSDGEKRGFLKGAKKDSGIEEDVMEKSHSKTRGNARSGDEALYTNVELVHEKEISDPTAEKTSQAAVKNPRVVKKLDKLQLSSPTKNFSDDRSERNATGNTSPGMKSAEKAPRKVSAMISEFKNNFNNENTSTLQEKTNVSSTIGAKKTGGNSPVAAKRSPVSLGAALKPPVKNVKPVSGSSNDNPGVKSAEEDSRYYSQVASSNLYDTVETAAVRETEAGVAGGGDDEYSVTYDVSLTDGNRPSKSQRPREEPVNSAVYATVVKNPRKFSIDDSEPHGSYNRVDFQDASRHSDSYPDHLLPADDTPEGKYYQLEKIYSPVLSEGHDEVSRTYSSPYDIDSIDLYDPSYSYSDEPAQYSEVYPTDRVKASPVIASKIAKGSEISKSSEQTRKRGNCMAQKGRELHNTEEDERSKASGGAFSRLGNRMKNVMNVLPHRRVEGNIDMNLNEKVYFRNQSVSSEEVRQQKPTGPRSIPSTWKQVLM